MNRPIKPVMSLCFEISCWAEFLGVWAAMKSPRGCIGSVGG